LPGPLKGLSADVSATFTESDAKIPGRETEKLPLRGFSDYLFTSSLSYAWRNFRARVDYRYRSDYIEGLDSTATEDEWFSPARVRERREALERAARIRLTLPESKPNPDAVPNRWEYERPPAKVRALRRVARTKPRGSEAEG
ncbi:MAG: hypothetical protein AABY08_02890, partial [Candidatus Thermoplasmatota archaeon]